MFMNIVKRMGLFIIYSAIAFGIFWFFIAGGHGTAAPVIVFCPWAILPAKLFWPNLYGFVSFCLLYYLGMAFLTTWLSPKTKSIFPLVPIIIHGIGCVPLLLLKERPEYDFAASVQGVATVISIAVVFCYLMIDWNLAKKRAGNQVEDKN
jgi:hypothetical protein